MLEKWIHRLCKRWRLTPLDLAEEINYFTRPMELQDSFRENKANRRGEWEDRIQLWQKGLAMDVEAKCGQRYPMVYEHEGRTFRYVYLPASRQPSLGLKVLFHPHNSLGNTPLNPLQEFDLLAPADPFGHVWQGSWFWGEDGDDFVARAVAELIQRHVSQQLNRPWFCMGACMGGFAALYHGMRLGCHGIYTINPQIDLRAIASRSDVSGRDGPVPFLGNGTLSTIPSVLDVAASQERIPPLFLSQMLYDRVAYFPEHVYPLLDILHRKKAWYALRVHPSLMHGSDCSHQEAHVFFKKILTHMGGSQEVLLADSDHFFNLRGGRP